MHGQLCPFAQLLCECADLARPFAVVTGEREGQADDNFFDILFFRNFYDVADGRTFARPSSERGKRLCDGGGRIADGEADAALAVINSEDATHSGELGERRFRVRAAANAVVNALHRFFGTEEEAAMGIAL